MKKKNPKVKIIIAIIIIIAIVLGFYFFKGKKQKMPEMETAKVTVGSIVNSVSADGIIEPVTNVEIKSNIGGTIVKLYADEGDYVKAGQLLAQIDPVDVLTTLEKEQNNVVSANSRLSSAKDSLYIEKEQAVNKLNSAKENVRSAQIKLDIAKREANAQPALTNNEIKTAKSNLEQAKSALIKMQKTTKGQSYTSAKTNYESALASFNSISKTHERNKVLLDKGYLSQKDYEAGEESYLSAKAKLDDAKHKYDTIDAEVASDIEIQKEKVKSCEIALRNAETNSINISTKRDNVTSAESALKSAKADLASAEANMRQISVKEQSVTQAQADLSSAKSSLKNAQKNYNYTNIIAPRDGVIVKKWTEEGSIIMGGRSSTAGSKEGVDIFELADITKMQVSVDVDETDVSSIRINQLVKISVDAFPNKTFTGKVTRICPSAETNSGVTTVPVEVTFDGVHKELKPEMNATCEFIIETHENILTLPVDFVDVTGDKGTAYILGNSKKPEPVQFKLGLVGDEAVEVKDTLKEGQEVINPRVMLMMMDPKKMKGMGPGGKSGGNRKGGGMPPMRR